MAGDAVQIAPVSGQIPCKQGILQGDSQFSRSGDDIVTEDPGAAATSQAFPYPNYQGKLVRETANFLDLGGK
jgi:hypothetical protein